MSMACQPCSAIGVNSAEAYDLRMTGEGLTYRERLCLWVQCHEYDADLAEASLKNNWQVQHRVIRGDLREIPPPHPPTPQM